MDPNASFPDPQRNQQIGLTGGLGGRIIFLGDGTEVMTHSSSGDADMVDVTDEDKDLESQVNKGEKKEGEKKEEGGEEKKEDTPKATEEKAGDVKMG